MIFMFIMAVISCGDCVFLGVMSQTVLVTFNPAFYWWGVAGYVAAGIFAIWGGYEIITYRRTRRKKSKKQVMPAVHQRDKHKTKTKKRSKK